MAGMTRLINREFTPSVVLTLNITDPLDVLAGKNEAVLPNAWLRSGIVAVILANDDTVWI